MAVKTAKLIDSKLWIAAQPSKISIHGKYSTRPSKMCRLMRLGGSRMGLSSTPTPPFLRQKAHKRDLWPVKLAVNAWIYISMSIARPVTWRLPKSLQ